MAVLGGLALTAVLLVAIVALCVALGRSAEWLFNKFR